MIKKAMNRLSLIQTFSLITLIAVIVLALGFGKVLNVFIEQTAFDKSLQAKIIWLLILAGFSSLYLMLFVIVRNASNHINKQTNEIMQSKQEWEKTFEAIPDIVTIHDKDFNIIKANKAAKEVLKLPSQMLNKPAKCYEYYHAKDAPLDGCISCECMKTNNLVSINTFEPCLDKHLDMRAMPLLDNNNELTGFIHITRDLTDIKKAEDENNKLQEQFIQIQKMESVGRLAGGIAHDFNNLLSVINGFSELALKEITEESTIKNYMTAVYNAGNKAASLTKQLLAFSRKQVLEMKLVNLNSIITNMSQMMSRLIGANVILNVELQDSILKVMADPVQIEQVLMNFTVNARDAMLNGGHLTINTSHEELTEKDVKDYEGMRPGSYVLLSVKDTGIGMKKEVREKIFEPFFTTKEAAKGTGMGLATVYGIIKQHKGYISVSSELGRGTEFSIYFPYAEGEIEEADAILPAKKATGDETILVVDDEPLLPELVVNVLKPLGYKVLAASNGKEALEVSRNFEGTIDLLLTDVIMPGMNGRDLAVDLLIERPETKVIFMSGYTDDSLDHQGILVKGVVLIHKPLSEKKLTNRIREVLDGKYQENAVQPESMDLGGMHILLADDNEDIVRLIRSYLKDYHCSIDSVEDGKAAVEKFKPGKYDLVIMDMQMPVMDGMAASKEIRKWENENRIEKTPIIAFSGNTSGEDIDNCIGAGCSSHLAKPIKKDQLIEVLFSYSSAKQTESCEIRKEKREKIVTHIDSNLEDIIPFFFEERRKDIQTLKDTLEINDYEIIRILGHSMKGSGGGYGFDIITDIGLHLENAAKEKNPEAVKKWLNKLEDYIDNVEVIYN